MKYKVLVVTPVLNGALWIKDCIGAVRQALTGQSYRHIVVDAGSTDDTLKIVHGLSDPYVDVMIERNSTIYQALNRAKSRYSFEYFYQLNADDLVLREGINAALHAADLFPNTIIVGVCVSIYESNKSFRMRLPLCDVDLGSAFLAGIYLPQPSVLVPESAFQLAGDFSESLKFAGDTEFWIRAQRSGVGFKCIPSLVSIDRVAATNARFSSRHQTEIEALSAEQGRRIFMSRWLLKSRYVCRNMLFYASAPKLLQGTVRCCWPRSIGFMLFLFSLTLYRLHISEGPCSGKFKPLGRIK